MDEGATKAVQEMEVRSETLRTRRRLPEVRAPRKGDLEWPDCLADITNEDLAKHLTFWASWAAYAQTQVAVVDGALVVARSNYEMEFDVRYNSSDETKVSDKRHVVGSSKSVRTLKRRVARLEADLKLLKSLLAAYEMRYNASSRELTRRVSEMENTLSRVKRWF